MDRLADELATSLRADGNIYEDLTLQNPLGFGLTTNLMRELREDGSRGPVKINADFSEVLGSSVHNEVFLEQDGVAISEYGPQSPSPGLLRRAKLLTRLVIGRPDHTFAELEFIGAFDIAEEE